MKPEERRLLIGVAEGLLMLMEYGHLAKYNFSNFTGNKPIPHDEFDPFRALIQSVKDIQDDEISVDFQK